MNIIEELVIGVKNGCDGQELSEFAKSDQQMKDKENNENNESML